MGPYDNFKSQRAFKHKPECIVSHLGEIHTERIHVQPIQEASKALAEARQALVHELKMHHVGFEIGNGIRQLGEGGLERVERERLAALDRALGRVAERRTRGGTEGRRGT